jgi:signal recognition particle subunit SRP54
MSGMMQKMSGMGTMDKMKAVKELTSSGLLNPGASLQVKKGSTKQMSPNQKAAEDKKKKARKDAKKQKKRNR